MTVPSHSQKVSHSYIVHYPPHPPRTEDPHYKDFHHYHELTKKDPSIYRCAHGVRVGDFLECDLQHPLELHHSHIEFSLQQGVDLAVLEREYPGVSDPEAVGAWVESAANLEWLCVFHHRGPNGKHTAATADYEASIFVRGLLSSGTIPPQPGAPDGS